MGGRVRTASELQEHTWYHLCDPDAQQRLDRLYTLSVDGQRVFGVDDFGRRVTISSVQTYLSEVAVVPATACRQGIGCPITTAQQCALGQQVEE